MLALIYIHALLMGACGRQSCRLFGTKDQAILYSRQEDPGERIHSLLSAQRRSMSLIRRIECTRCLSPGDGRRFTALWSGSRSIDRQPCGTTSSRFPWIVHGWRAGALLEIVGHDTVASCVPIADGRVQPFPSLGWTSRVYVHRTSSPRPVRKCTFVVPTP